MSAMMVADWMPVGSGSFFRRFDIYTMEWLQEMDIENIVIAAAPYGGPMAIVRDRKKLIKIQVTGKPVISIYSAPGILMSSIKWNSGQLMHLGWSSEEELLCIKDDGTVIIYDMQGTMQTRFSMGEEVSTTKIHEAKVFPSSMGTGIAVLTTKYHVFLVSSVKEPKVRQLPDIPSSMEPPTGWEIVSSSVIISKGQNFCLLKQSEQPVALNPYFTSEYSGIIDMCVSLDNKHIALFTDTGILWMGSSDMKKCYCEYNTNCSSRPKQIVWCGAEAVIANWTHELIIVERSGSSKVIPYTCPVFLIPEIDGVRVVSSYLHEMIQRVPKLTHKIFSFNSSEPGSYLLEASKQYDKKSHTSYEYIQLLTNNLEVAVNQCIQAAGYEFNPSLQKKLLRAAKFGKTLCPEISALPFVQMCRILRVLNAVRCSKIGIPLTYSQLNHLSLRTLLDRLVLRRQHKQAIEIATYLRMPEVEGSSRILAHWACYKVKQTHLDQEELAVKMADKLGHAPGVSYSEIACKAADAGRTKLAIKLLDYEAQASLQVPLLLRLGQQEQALARALDSGNTDLVHTVMSSLRDTMPLGDFQMMIRNFPVAQSLYLISCRQNTPETLRDIYSQEDDYVSQAKCFIRDFYDSKNSSKDSALSSAVECFNKARDEFSSGLCKEHQKLLSQQRSLEDKFRRDFVGSSLHETVRLLLTMKELKLAEKLRSEHKMPDRRFWWLRIQTLSELGEWSELDKFSKVKKSPIGYEPFVDVCLLHKERFEAQKYLPKVKDEVKVKYYVKVGLMEEAAQFAFEQKDKELLEYLQTCCSTEQRQAGEKIKSYLAQLSAKK